MPQKDRISGMNTLRGNLERHLETVLQNRIWNFDFDKKAFSMLHKRFSRVSVRSYFVYQLYHYLLCQVRIEKTSLREDVSPQIFEIHLPFIADALIAHAYYHNQILDGKSGVTTTGRIQGNLLSAELLRGFIMDYARENLPEGETLYKTVLPRLDHIFECVGVAQVMDKNWGNYQIFAQGLPADTTLVPKFSNLFRYAEFATLEQKILEYGLSPGHVPFTQLYLRRAFLANAPLFILMAEIVMDLLGYEGTGREGVLKFAGNYGLIVQIVNDISDFAPARTVEKDEEDAFSDLKNGAMSLPLILFFSENLEITFSNLQKTARRSEQKALKIMLPTILKRSIPLSIWFSKEHHLAGFLDKDNPEHKLLADLLSLGYDNKYFHYFWGKGKGG